MSRRVRYVFRTAENAFAEFGLDIRTGEQNAGAAADVLRGGNCGMEKPGGERHDKQARKQRTAISGHFVTPGCVKLSPVIDQVCFRKSIVSVYLTTSIRFPTIAGDHDCIKKTHPYELPQDREMSNSRVSAGLV